MIFHIFFTFRITYYFLWLSRMSKKSNKSKKSELIKKIWFIRKNHDSQPWFLLKITGTWFIHQEPGSGLICACWVVRLQIVTSTASTSRTSSASVSAAVQAWDNSCCVGSARLVIHAPIAPVHCSYHVTNIHIQQ